jgi:hypothetical protein
MHGMNNAKLAPTDLLILSYGSDFCSINKEHTGRLQKAEMPFISAVARWDQVSNGSIRDNVEYKIYICNTLAL